MKLLSSLAAPRLTRSDCSESFLSFVLFKLVSFCYFCAMPRDSHNLSTSYQRITKPEQITPTHAKACFLDMSSLVTLVTHVPFRVNNTVDPWRGDVHSGRVLFDPGAFGQNGTEIFRKFVFERLSIFFWKFGNSGNFVFHLAFLPGMNRPPFF